MRILSIVFCLSTLLVLTAATSAQTTFTNAGAIPIADGGNLNGTAPGVGNPYPSVINVSGLTGTITDINVRINGFSHTYPSDIGMLLVAPNGARFVIQSDVGADVTVSNITYTLDDQAGTSLPTNSGLSSGTFKPTSLGDDDFFPQTGTNPPPTTCQPAGTCAQPAPAGSATLNGTFGGINPNGAWKLYAIDVFSGDTGQIGGGWSLIITTNGGGNLRKTALDFNGDQRTDYVVVRNTGGGTAGQITWFVALSNGGPIPSVNWGIATDFFVPGDFDGDGRSDYAIWRPGAQGQFYILNSQTFTVRVDPFGTNGDDPTVIGDYNGDGTDDVAVYRGGTTTADPSTWFYRPAPNAPYVSVNFGMGGDIPAPGDYDGDKKNDYVIQRNAGNGQGIFYKLLTTGVYTTEIFGNASDVVAPGDYDGDGKTDVCVIAAVNGSMVWSFRPSANPGGATVSDTWGIAGDNGDFPAQGDYTGDGKTDFAVWRPSNGSFYVLTPITKSISITSWGVNGDYPVANYNVH